MYIGEFSRRTGASPKAIRLYESMNLLIGVKRKGNYRIYNESDVCFVKLIKEAQTLGASLSELKPLIIRRNQFDWPSFIKLLHQKQQQAEDEIASLIEMKKRIESCRDYIENNIINA